MHARQLVLGESFLAQRVEAVLVRLAAPDGPDVAGLLLQHRAQSRQVELRVVSQHDDVCRVVDRDLGHRLIRPRDDQLVGLRESLFGGELRARVDHRYAIAHQLGETVQGDRDVDRADDDQVGRTPKRLDKYIALTLRKLGA